MVRIFRSFGLLNKEPHAIILLAMLYIPFDTSAISSLSVLTSPPPPITPSSGYANLPGLTWWWQGFAAGYLDFTNPEATAWWSNRLEQIRSKENTCMSFLGANLMHFLYYCSLNYNIYFSEPLLLIH